MGGPRAEGGVPPSRGDSLGRGWLKGEEASEGLVKWKLKTHALGYGVLPRRSESGVNLSRLRGGLVKGRRHRYALGGVGLKQNQADFQARRAKTFGRRR